ncbi:MAG: insulinase family protein [Polyangiaceae bacterium]|nr:insulinase family protein [Polyangiaceae bacterium]
MRHRYPRVLTAAVLCAPLLAQSGPALADVPTPSPPTPAATSGKLAIPFEKFQLPNGMTIILSEDHSVPLVAVNTMVKVGSRFEKAKRSGFAHLFEHLMFMGTDRVPTGTFDTLMESEGGWNNAWTSEDRTDYFDVGPAHTLPLLLWLEADRLSSLGTSMTQAKLDAQRKVVRNERRERSENKPYGKVELRLPELLYPEGHPYHHPVIGSHEDLEAAKVEDVKAFFSEYYAANNLSLVVAGDFDPKTVRPEIERLFGALQKGNVPAAPPATVPKLTDVVRETLVEDNIQLPKIVMAWHSPARFAPGDAELDILSNVLDRGKTSRLYKALVFDKELAQSVSATQGSQDLSSIFTIEAIARPGVKLDDLEKEIDKILAELNDKGATQAEVERAKNDYETMFVLQLESVPERASILNNYQTFAGDPGFIGKDLERYRKVDQAGVNATVKATLDPKRRVILRVEPKKAEAAPKAPAKKAPAKKGAGK